MPGDNESCSNYDPRDDGNFRDESRFDEEEDERLSRPSNRGAEDRHRARFLMESVDECRPGLTCDRTQGRCMESNS